MAQIVFRNIDTLELGDLIGYAKTDTDLEYITRGYNHLYKIFDITDSEYEDVFNGVKEVEISNITPTLVTLPITDEGTVNKEVFTNELENFKSHLRDALAVKTNHSKKTEANEIMEYLNSIDVESLTYPTVHLPQKMRDDNKFMALNAF
jgi:hypothetical protein